MPLQHQGPTGHPTFIINPRPMQKKAMTSLSIERSRKGNISRHFQPHWADLMVKKRYT